MAKLPVAGGNKRERKSKEKSFPFAGPDFRLPLLSAGDCWSPLIWGDTVFQYPDSQTEGLKYLFRITSSLPGQLQKDRGKWWYTLEQVLPQTEQPPGC